MCHNLKIPNGKNCSECALDGHTCELCEIYDVSKDKNYRPCELGITYGKLIKLLGFNPLAQESN